MIGYVLLIVIAISISIFVFSFLKLYLPKDQPECRTDISLVITDFDCSGGNLNVNLVNKGLFTADRVQIRIGDAGRIAKELLNIDDDFKFTDDTGIPIDGLNPGEEWEYTTLYTETGIKELEIQAAMFIDNKLVLCEDTVIKRDVICS